MPGLNSPHLTGTPTWARLSMKSTEAPISAAYHAVVLPAGPDPPTSTSTFSISSPLTVHHVLRDVQKSIPVYRIGEGIQDGTGRFGDLLGLRHASLHGIGPLDELQRTEDVVQAMMNRSSDVDIYCLGVDSAEYAAV